MLKEVKTSLNSVKLMLLLSILVFLMTFEELNLNGIPLIILGLIIYFYHSGIQNNWWGNEKHEEKFVNEGLYKHIRHPIFLSIIIIHLGTALLMNSVIYFFYTLFLVFPYIYFRASVEDEILKEKFPDYSEKIKHTKMFIPKIL